MFNVGDEVLFTDKGAGSPRRNGVPVPQPIIARVVRVRCGGGYTIQFFDTGIGWGVGCWDVKESELSLAFGPTDVIDVDE